MRKRPTRNRHWKKGYSKAQKYMNEDTVHTAFKEWVFSPGNKSKQNR
jgi:hypothetical protein